MEYYHKSVLLDECIENLHIKEGGIYVDGTLGGAGHFKEILKHLRNGIAIGIDRDLDALENIQSGKNPIEEYGNEVYIIEENHENIPYVLDVLNIDKVDGILLDLGMSSYQIDNKDRGFTYLVDDAILDMRMSQNADVDAKHILNTYSKEELVRIFKEYGQEPFASKIAQKIVEQRKISPITTVGDLNKIIFEVKPFSKKGHKSKQIFQALRIEVNKEIVNLENAIIQMAKRVNTNGYICIITFHSLEDIAVKNAFKKLQGQCTCPPTFPVCVCNFESYGKIVTKKPILPSQEELANNSRSKSAKLRVFKVIQPK